jgi:hypothetical protein
MIQFEKISGVWLFIVKNIFWGTRRNGNTSNFYFSWTEKIFNIFIIIDKITAINYVVFFASLHNKCKG